MSLPTNVPTLMSPYQVDPYLQLVDDCKLEAVNAVQNQPSEVYGSKEDDEDALKSLSTVQKTQSKSKETFATMIVQSLATSPEVIIH